MTPHYPQGHVFYRNLHYSYPLISHGKGACLYDVNGINGDLVLIAPPLIVTQKEIFEIVDKLREILLEMEKFEIKKP